MPIAEIAVESSLVGRVLQLTLLATTEAILDGPSRQDDACGADEAIFNHAQILIGA